MKTFSALLAFFAGYSTVTGEFPAQKPVTRSFDVFFHLCMNKRLSKQSWGWWFEMPSRSLWRHRNDINGFCMIYEWCEWCVTQWKATDNSRMINKPCRFACKTKSQNCISHTSLWYIRQNIPHSFKLQVQCCRKCKGVTDIFNWNMYCPYVLWHNIVSIRSIVELPLNGILPRIPIDIYKSFYTMILKIHFFIMR